MTKYAPLYQSHVIRRHNVCYFADIRAVFLHRYFLKFYLKIINYIFLEGLKKYIYIFLFENICITLLAEVFMKRVFFSKIWMSTTNDQYFSVIENIIWSWCWQSELFVCLAIWKEDSTNLIALFHIFSLCFEMKFKFYI